MLTEILCGDNLPILREMADNSVDAIVTDPPYGLSFMGKRWDYDVPSVELWAECLRVLKPGGHLLAFAGTRTQHRMAVRIEDAGFEIRDMIAWVYGSGFPKSHNVAIGIDKMNGAPARGKALVFAGRGERKDLQGKDANPRPQDLEAYAPATDAAKQWDGWGTALKPALEPITLARKPLGEKTVAANVLEWGTGGVNVDGCRVGTDSLPAIIAGQSKLGTFERNAMVTPERNGRFPANFIHDGSDDVVRLFPVTGPSKAAARGGTNPNPMDWGNSRSDGTLIKGHDDQGGTAARFFYCAKASRSEREAGLEGVEARDKYGPAGQWGSHDCFSGKSGDADWAAKHPNLPKSNHHPTVKPIALMRYLCRLVTPPGGIVLDPFTGSGTTGCAATLEGFGFIGIEREAEYAEIARRRVEHWRDVATEAETIVEDVQEKLFVEIG